MCGCPFKVPTLDKVSVDLMVVLGTTSMPIHQVMRLSRGAIIELDVSPTMAPRLREVLAAGGWQIRG